MTRELTWLIATKLRLPTERRKAAEDAGDEMSSDSLRDWWRLRLLLISASCAFSSLYWLHFSCLLMGNMALSVTVLPYMAIYGHQIQMRYVCPCFVCALGSAVCVRARQGGFALAFARCKCDIRAILGATWGCCTNCEQIDEDQ